LGTRSRGCFCRWTASASRHSPRTPAPISEQGHGAEGTLAIATGLSQRGWGFPLIHDITDVLRIGDITFIRPRQTPEFVTVEVKTRLLNEFPPDETGSAN
jgi:hypothetical protein